MSGNLRWYHVIVSSYGAWLPGDARGFRARHHREHVVGDYRNPPPQGRYTARETRSKRLLKQQPVVFDPTTRAVIGQSFVDKLQRLGAIVICLAAAGQHVHFLAKMPARLVRHWTGIAKKHTTFELRPHGWNGKVWGQRSKAVPIRDRRHQLNVYSYIVKHGKRGAWIWTWPGMK